MKKMAIFLIFVLLGSIELIAQERDQDRIQDQDRTNLVMINGEMTQIRDRDQVRLQEPMTFKNGSTVTPKGLYTAKDGKQLKLKNGECLDGNGMKYGNEYQYRNMINQQNKKLTKEQVQERNQNRIHYMLMDGEMLQIRNQFQEKLQTSMKLKNGTVVNPNGTYQIKNREQKQLKDGQCLNMDGKLFQNQLQHRKTLIQANKKIMNKKSTPKKVNTNKNKVKKSGNK